MNLSRQRNARAGFSRIVCPVDLTPDSGVALQQAVALAKEHRAKIFLLHCVERAEVIALNERLRLKEQLESLIKRYLPQGEKASEEAVEYAVMIVEGEPAETIAAQAADCFADLIVMRSKRRAQQATPLGVMLGSMLGSTAEALSRIAPCPLLVSHPQERQWRGANKNRESDDGGRPQRILVAYDFSIDAELALAYALSFAQGAPAAATQIHLLHVLPQREDAETPELSFLPYHSDQVFQQAALRLTSVVPRHAYADCEVIESLRAGQPYREVLNYAEEEKIELICIGASGTGYGMRALFGSNTDRVVRQSPCPVLIARPLRPRQRSVHDEAGL